MAQNDEMRKKTLEHIERLGGEEVVDQIGDWLMRCLAMEGACDINETQRAAGFEEIHEEIRSSSLNEYAKKHAEEVVVPFLITQEA